MLTYSLSKKSGESLYVRLYQRLKEDILAGRLAAGEKLPSKRAFAKNLGVSLVTVETAYAQLISEGYVRALPRRGFFVSTLAAPPPAPAEAAVPQKSAQKEARLLADFASNRAPLDKFPFSVFSRLLREALRDAREELLSPPPPEGLPMLREAIARHLFAFRGIRVSGEQIVIGAGTEQLYGELVRLLGRGKIYGLEDPGYGKIAKVYESFEASCRFIPLDSGGIDIGRLERESVQIAHISPAHHFPTGLVTSVSRRYELLAWAARGPERYIIEDDYDSEFRLQGRPIPTLQSIDAEGHVIFMNTFSKSLAPSLRLAYMVLPPKLLTLYREKLPFSSSPVAGLIQYALARFIGEGFFERHINRMRTYYRRERDFLLAQIKKSLPEAEIREENAGLHFLLRLKVTTGDEEFSRRLLARGIRLLPLSSYARGAARGESHVFVVNYSSLSQEQIRSAVKILAEEVSK